MPISEERLLSRVLQGGLLSPGELASAVPPRSAEQGAARWGPRIDALIARGRLTDDTVARLAAELAGADADAARLRGLTQEDSLPAAAHPIGETLPAPVPSGISGYAQTLDSTQPGAAERSAPPSSSTPSSSGDGGDGASAAPSSASPSSVSVSAFPVPSWTRYEFLGLLGRGGMGAVYKGRDRRLGRTVALKFIHGDNPGQIQRFMQEARAQARLEHPNICQVYEVGTVDSRPYIAMQYVDGLPFDQASRAMTLTEKVSVMKDAAEAMHAAHEQGIIHRGRYP